VARQMLRVPRGRRASLEGGNADGGGGVLRSEWIGVMIDRE